MKKQYLVHLMSIFLMFLFLTSCSSISDLDQNLSAKNKEIVTQFYKGVFIDHRVEESADQFIGAQYIQHNPNVPDGKEPFVQFFKAHFIENPEAHVVIKRVIAEGNLVAFHVNSKINKQDVGVAIVDIFRVENGKIVEHWDVIQPVVDSKVNSNTMF